MTVGDPLVLPDPEPPSTRWRLVVVTDIVLDGYGSEDTEERLLRELYTDIGAGCDIDVVSYIAVDMENGGDISKIDGRLG